MRALNIVGENFEFGLREHFRALFQQQRIVLHRGIGLLARRARHMELALEHAAPAIQHRALGQLARHAGRRAMAHMRSDVRLQACARKISGIDRGFRARLAVNQARLKPCDLCAERQRRQDAFRARILLDERRHGLGFARPADLVDRAVEARALV